MGWISAAPLILNNDELGFFKVKQVEERRDSVKALFTALNAGKDPPYYNRPIPCDFDHRIGNLVRQFIQADPSERTVILSAISRENSGWFFAFSDRMAALGVREKSRERLIEGLLALVIEGGKFDMRENIASLGLHYHSATKIGIDPYHLFEEAASYADNAVSDEILDFPTRKPEERSLKAMGYVEAYAEDGFRYDQAYKPRRT